MNCDQAFDALTSADGLRSAELQGHLDACPRCRDMAVTLAPALELFGAGRHDDMRDTHGWEHPAAPITAVQAARAAAQRWTQHGRRHGSRSWLVEGLKIGGAGVVAAALVMVLTGGPASESVSPSTAAASCQWIDRGSVAQTRPSAAVLSMACMNCHLQSASPAVTAAPAISKSHPATTLACVACHKPALGHLMP